MSFIKLIRPQQWYKNIVIFIAIFFAGELFNINFIKLTVLGFASLCLISSVNYILNDFFDIKQDQKHPEKKKRPLASGIIKPYEAIFFAIILFIIAAINAYYLSIYFFYVILTLFLLTQIYSMFLKNEPFLDIILIGINFVLRSISGAYLINKDISPWLIICAFFVALFMGFGKRRSDLEILGEKAIEHKKVYRYYSIDLLNSLINSTLSVIILSYTLYTFLKEDSVLIITIPIIVYALFRYLYLIKSGSIVARHPEYIIKDYRIILSIMIWGLIIFISHYII